MTPARVAVIGAGPAGLGAAHALVRGGARVTVFEAGNEVGGLARSFDLWGQRVEYGAHLLLRVDPRIDALWDELIGEDFVAASRRTRILSRGRWLRYPYEPLDALRAIGLHEALRCAAGLARRGPDGDDLERWVVSRFGRPAFELFVADYVRKLLGVPASDIDAAFAGTLLGFQRQSSLAATGRRVLARAPEPPVVRPLGGVGELLSRMAADVERRGGVVRLGAPVERLVRRDGAVAGMRIDGVEEPFDHVISTAPIPVLLRALGDVPEEIARRRDELRARGVVIVYLLLDGAAGFDDQWVYVTDPANDVGRITNFSAWRADGAPMPAQTILAAEIGEEAKAPAPALAERELRELGLLGHARVVETHVVRLPRVQPVPLTGAAAGLAPVRAWLETIRGLTTTGRHGAFANTGVHESILLGMDAAANVQILSP
ncbi:MAG: FAD-dependent oxidoreductase [Solirubrobacteraceae bacterium]|nr:FAD-dependent oxidoreductase [Solirubrobacteraceae bacterium]